MPSKGMNPNRLKTILISSNDVSPGMIPQKQGTAQFMGSCISGCRVSVIWTGSKVSNGVSNIVGEGVSDGGLIVPPVVDGTVLVIAGRIDVATVGVVVDCAGCLVGLMGAHPAKARTGITKKENTDNGFIIATF